MSLLLGALYRSCDPAEVVRHWRERLGRLAEPRLTLRTDVVAHGALRIQVRTRPGARVPHRRLGRLARMAIGPDREEYTEFWLLEPAGTSPGFLRLAGSTWEQCLQSLTLPRVRQVRLWSPMVCPGPLRGEIQGSGSQLGLKMRILEGWVLMAIPRRKPEPPHHAPWQGNYGW